MQNPRMIYLALMSSEPELKEIFDKICYMYAIRLQQDVQECCLQQKAITEFEKTHLKATDFIEKSNSFCVRVNGELITLKECRDKIELALSSDIVKSIKATLNNITQPKATSSTSAINTVIANPVVTNIQPSQIQASASPIASSIATSELKQNNQKGNKPSQTLFSPAQESDKKSKVHLHKNKRVNADLSG